MWLVKKAASKVAKISEKVLKEDSEAEKIIKDIIGCKQEVLPVKKMAQLATLTYDMQNFQKAMAFLKEKLNDIKMQRKSLKKRLNLLTVVSYLLKHGASGFIDEFRSMTQIFTKYEILAVTENQEDQQLFSILLDLSQRANYIKMLLGDKSALAREKQLARKIKEKIMSQGGDYSRQNKDIISGEREEQTGEKVQSFLEHYVWRYTSKLDKKIDQITDALITKIDEYLDGQIPESFQIDQLETDSTKQQAHGQTDLKLKLIQAEKQFIKCKVPLQKQSPIVNLIDLDPIQAEPLSQEDRQQGLNSQQQPKHMVEKNVQLLLIDNHVVKEEQGWSLQKQDAEKIAKQKGQDGAGLVEKQTLILSE